MAYKPVGCLKRRIKTSISNVYKKKRKEGRPKAT